MSKKLTQLNEDDLSTKSQATYYFECNEDGTSKGSFCCILKKDTEYFILTAGHNLQNGTSIGSKYKLIKDASNYVELELIKDYRETYDASILKINKITKSGKINYCDKVYIRNTVENSKKYYYKEYTNKFYDIETRVQVEGEDKDFKLTTEKFSAIDEASFYKNAIKFGNNYYPNELSAKGEIGVLVGYISKTGVAENFEGGVDYSEANKVTEESFPGRFFQISKSTIGGDSGCVVFTKFDDTSNKLLGIYLGNRGDIPKKGRCRPYYSLEKSYNIV